MEALEGREGDREFRHRGEGRDGVVIYVRELGEAFLIR